MGGWRRQNDDQWARPIATFMALLLTAALLCLVGSARTRAQEATDTGLNMRLNPTGRVLNMPLPLLDNNQQLGELVARIDPDDSIWVRKDALLRLLTGRVKPAVTEAISALPETGGQINIKNIAASGAELRFDQAAVALKIAPKADLRTAQTISVSGAAPNIASSRTVEPAAFSGYLNVISGLDHLWGTEDSDAQTSLHFDLQSALRAGAYILENEAGYDGDVDAESCPHDAYCNYTHRSGLKRRNTRVVYDLPDEAVRFQAGDTTTRPAGFQRITDILGLAIERSPRTLQPETAGRATTSTNILIDRPSQAEISVNGTVVRRLRLQPGNYDLNDLRLVSGINDIEITLIDDTGARRTISQSTYFDRRLLAQDDSEWSVAAGLPSYYRDGERDYTYDNFAASGFYRWGLTDRLTSELNVQADSDVQLAGAGLLTGTPWGFFAARTALSVSDGGVGFALGADWDLVNFGDFSGLIAEDAQQRQSLRLSVEYRSDAFRLPGEFLTTASGLLYPTYDYRLRLSGTYTVPIGWGVSAALAGRYQFGRDGDTSIAYAGHDDRYGADIAFSGAITERINGSIAFGYSNESYLLSNNATGASGADFRVMARAFVRRDSNTHITASYDSLNQQSIVTGYHTSGQGVGRWETTIDSYNDQLPDRGSVGGTITHYGNRAEVSIAHNSALSDLTWTTLNPEFGQQRTSLRVGTSIAFADGKVAVGAPIRSGFAIVYPHESLQDNTITIGTRDQVLARADGWGAAVVPNLPTYSQTTLPIDVDDLPVGYSLGSGSFDLRPPFRAGYALMVGSGSSVSAFGTLTDASGAPLALLAGVAYPVSQRSNEVTVFTNAAGRFAAEGLAPGAWRIEMSDGARTLVYSLQVPEGTDGLVRAGTLRPDGAAPSPAQSSALVDKPQVASPTFNAPQPAFATLPPT